MTQVAKLTLVTLCRTWPGLIALSNDQHCLRALLSTMLVGPDERGHLILDAVFEILCMHHLTRDAKASSERPTDARSISSSALHYSASSSSGFAPGAHARPRLVQWYVVVVLQALMHCGLLQAWPRHSSSPQ